MPKQNEGANPHRLNTHLQAARACVTSIYKHKRVARLGKLKNTHDITDTLLDGQGKLSSESLDPTSELLHPMSACTETPPTPSASVKGIELKVSFSCFLFPMIS